MRLLSLITLLTFLFGSSESVKCMDCVGIDCMGSFCYGEYCVISNYAPRWGTVEWGHPEVVKGCMNGTLLRSDIRDHCEVADIDDDPFTCFCNGHLCNGKNTRKLEKEVVELVTCRCSGSHCRGKSTCSGEMCSYVINHRTKEIEQGCVNATVPLVERRSLGACMIPPITGAMHHTVAKDAESLLSTESCVCGTDFCNAEKPKPKVPERQKCQAFVRASVMGNAMASRNTTCRGEFCFKASIKSKLGTMTEYHTIGCASFTGDDELPEELNPTGCAQFNNDDLSVSACFKTDDQGAINRVRAQQRVPEPRQRKGKSRPKPKETVMEVEYGDDDDNAEEVVDEDDDMDEPTQKPRKQQKEEAKEERVKEEPKPETTTAQSFIFQNPTQAPIPDDSNTTMVTVFILIMLCIVVSGAVWKLELHKKLFRANYDSVAGG
ncbi:unnamed protein product [Auanema sp. JU1783]|nr:unnamed protein product [Auanema sp. JU1783]